MAFEFYGSCTSLLDIYVQWGDRLMGRRVGKSWIVLLQVKDKIWLGINLVNELKDPCCSFIYRCLIIVVPKWKYLSHVLYWNAKWLDILKIELLFFARFSYLSASMWLKNKSHVKFVYLCYLFWNNTVALFIYLFSISHLCNREVVKLIRIMSEKTYETLFHKYCSPLLEFLCTVCVNVSISCLSSSRLLLPQIWVEGNKLYEDSSEYIIYLRKSL